MTSTSPSPSWKGHLTPPGFWTKKTNRTKYSYEYEDCDDDDGDDVIKYSILPFPQEPGNKRFLRICTKCYIRIKRSPPFNYLNYLLYLLRYWRAGAICTQSKARNNIALLPFQFVEPFQNGKSVEFHFFTFNAWLVTAFCAKTNPTFPSQNQSLANSPKSAFNKLPRPLHCKGLWYQITCHGVFFYSLISWYCPHRHNRPRY